MEGIPRRLSDRRIRRTFIHTPLIEYTLTSVSDDQSVCHGTVDVLALHLLGEDGFQRALELYVCAQQLSDRQAADGLLRAFDREQVWVRLYWRPHDNRARILVMTKDRQMRDLHYCISANNLKVIRDRSCLQLCQARSNGRYRLWARLKFVTYESMWTRVSCSSDGC